MLNSIKNFFEQHLSVDDNLPVHEHTLQLATAALLIEMMHQDNKEHQNEIKTIKQSLKKTFDLSDNETQELYKLALEEIKQATDYYQFTKLIQDNYGQAEKIHIIELLWRVAYADNELDAYEEHMIRRIADLIYVPHSEFIKTKHKVQKHQDSNQ